MSLPKESVEQLLSGYLDGALSRDERQRVEMLLRQDPAVAAELESLRSLRSSLKELHRHDAKSLGPEFASRTVEAAVARARSEGMSDDHPLMRVAEQPAESATRYRQVGVFGVAGLVAALSASILLAFFLMPGDGAAPRGPGQTQLADARQLEELDVEQESQDVDIAAEEGLVIDASANLANKAGVALGDSETDASVPSTAAVASGQDSPATGDSLANDDRLANVDPPEMSRDGRGSLEEAAAVSRQAVLVVNVKRTDEGRASSAVRRAMRQAGLTASAEQPASQDLVNSTSAAVEEVDQTRASLLFLKAPAKQLDRFVMAMVDDLQGIESVGWSVVFDVPVKEPAGPVSQVDPETVREAAPWRLGGDQADQSQWLRSFQDQEYLSLREGSSPRNGGAGSFAMATGSVGPDVSARLIVLVQ